MEICRRFLSSRYLGEISINRWKLICKIFSEASEVVSVSLVPFPFDEMCDLIELFAIEFSEVPDYRFI